MAEIVKDTRDHGNIALGLNIEPTGQSILDARLQVKTLSDLYGAYVEANNYYPYMVVTVQSEKAQYMLVNVSKVTEAEGWKRMDQAALDEIAKLGNALDYQGSVASFDQLPDGSAEHPVKKGDVYNVVAANGNIPAGTNYAWNGEEWDPLGGSVDLSGYATKTDIENVESAYQAADLTIQGSINDINSKIGEIEGKLNPDTEGSIASDINTLKESLKIKDVGSNSSNLVSLALGENGILTVTEDISGQTVKVGANISIPNVTAETTVNDAVKKVYDAVAVKEVNTTTNIEGINLTISNGILGLNTNQNNLIKSLCGLTGVAWKGTINGVNVKLGSPITSTNSEGQQVEVYGENTTIATVLQNMNDSIKSAVAGGITGVNAGDGIEVSGDANTKTIKLKVAVDSALKIDENNALSLVWEEIE